MSTSFLVECLIQRKNGTHPTMPPTDQNPNGKTYHFVPTDTDERHIAKVDDMVHLTRFIQISEAYRIVEAPTPVVSEPATGTEGGLLGGGASLPNPDPGQTEPVQTTASVLGIVAGPVDTPQAVVAAPAGDVDPEDGLPVDLDKLRAIFETEVGRKPHPSAKRESMVAQIKLVREAPVVATVKAE